MNAKGDDGMKTSYNTTLHPIAMEYLYEGLLLAEDIYNYDGKLLLLAKGNVLTARKLEQLREFNLNNRNISVFEETYQTLLQHGLSDNNTLTQAYVEQEVGYTDIKEQTEQMLENIRATKTVDSVSAETVAEEMYHTLHKIDPSLIFQCINAPNPIDEYLRRHSTNVGLMNGLMGHWLHLEEREIALLILAGLVHDVGKTQIPDPIINAPRSLTISEFEAMKMHPVYSYQMLCEGNQFAEEVCLAARHHHEKMNGSGYPDRLSADQISLFARITAVSDIYDAMVSKRVYKDANNPFLILAQLSHRQFSELDMHLVKLFTQHMPLELVGKPVLLSDGSIGIVRFLVPNDLEYPLVEVNGAIIQTNQQLHCKRMVFDEE